MITVPTLVLFLPFVVVAAVGFWLGGGWIYDRTVTPLVIRRIAGKYAVSEESVRDIWSQLDAGSTVMDMNLGKEAPMREREREQQGARPEEKDED